MKFFLKSVSGDGLWVENVISYEMDRSIKTPCDSISLSFFANRPIGEQSEIQAWRGNTLVFNGFVDYQSQVVVSEQSKVLVRGRSSACILVDSECAPVSYQTPSVDDLFAKYAEPYGFTSLLPQIVCDYNLDVVKGSSRWTVLHNFVKSLGVNGFYVDPKNSLVPLSDDGQSWVVSNDWNFCRRESMLNNRTPCHFITAELKFKRSSAISKVTYKIDSSDKYKYSAVCHQIADRGIQRERYLNLANIPGWKRTSAVHSVIENSVSDYFTLTVSVGEDAGFQLNDKVDFVDKTIGQFLNLRIKEITCVNNGGDEKTILHMVSGEKVKEDIYVD